LNIEETDNTDMNNSDTDIKTLEALVINNPDLERLESLLGQFNLFEALGAVHVEVRHSDFLAFLLAPSESHGLGDFFVKRLLQSALSISAGQTLPITLIDLDTWDFDEMIVLREWQNIDLLLLDQRNQLAVIIENKIHSSEHSDQLGRYWRTIQQHYPDWRILGLFLSPEGDPPSDDNYNAIGYASVCEILENLIKTRSSALNSDVRVAIIHYTQMLRRHIMSESEIAELCQRIYRKHKRAIDMIYEYRPDQQGAIQEMLVRLVESEPNLILDHSSKSYVRFGLKEWDVPLLHQGEGWTNTGRMLLFQFNNFEDRLWLYLVIGPGPIDTRQKLHDVAHAHKPPFKPAYRALNKKWNTIYQREILSPSTYHGTTAEEKEVEIQKKWAQFLAHDLPQIQSFLKSEAWIWKSQ
jgi:hypothetical protein